MSPPRIRMITAAGIPGASDWTRTEAESLFCGVDIGRKEGSDVLWVCRETGGCTVHPPRRGDGRKRKSEQEKILWPWFERASASVSRHRPGDRLDPMMPGQIRRYPDRRGDLHPGSKRSPGLPGTVAMEDRTLRIPTTAPIRADLAE
jgi:hypothetical protein